jgi:hypothetical protein
VLVLVQGESFTTDFLEALKQVVNVMTQNAFGCHRQLAE